MEELPEVIISSTSSYCSMHDSKTGNVVYSFKEYGIGEIGSKSLCVLKEDYFVAAAATTPAIKLWIMGGINNKLELTKFLAPAPISVLVSSSCGLYCAAASKNDIYLWKVTSGEMLSKSTRHTQSITCLQFSSDDSHLISGGKDALVLVWLFSNLANTYNQQQNKPRFVWNSHSAEITGIYTGPLGMYSRVATVSADMTCKLYELDSGILLTTICTDQLLSSVCMDALEYFIVLGTDSGYLCKINIYDCLPIEMHYMEDRKNKVLAHMDKVSILSVSSETTNILSASPDKTIKVWDMGALCCNLTINLDEPVLNAFFAIRPTSLSIPKFRPSFYVKTFKRTLNSEENTGNESKREYEEVKPHTEEELYTPRSLLENPNLFKLLHKMPTDTITSTGSSKYEDMFQSVLNSQTVNDLHVINSQMYSFAMKHLMSQKENDQNKS